MVMLPSSSCLLFPIILEAAVAQLRNIQIEFTNTKDRSHVHKSSSKRRCRRREDRVGVGPAEVRGKASVGRDDAIAIAVDRHDRRCAGDS